MLQPYILIWFYIRYSASLSTEHVRMHLSCNQKVWVGDCIKYKTDCCIIILRAELFLYRIVERPLHYMEAVIEVTMRWATWPMEFCRDNYLCMKRNVVYEGIELVVSTMQYNWRCTERINKNKSCMRACYATFLAIVQWQ